MKNTQSLLLTLCLAACTCTLALAQEFKIYPGSRVDENAGRQASSRSTQSEVYTTSDSFEKVCAFYRALYKEHRWPLPPPTLPSGKPVQWAFFILDGAKDIVHSKSWVKVQHPYILTVDENVDFKGIRDVTLIQKLRKN